MLFSKHVLRLVNAQRVGKEVARREEGIAVLARSRGKRLLRCMPELPHSAEKSQRGGAQKQKL